MQKQHSHNHSEHKCTDKACSCHNNKSAAHSVHIDAPKKQKISHEAEISSGDDPPARTGPQSDDCCDEHGCSCSHTEGRTWFDFPLNIPVLLSGLLLLAAAFLHELTTAVPFALSVSVAALLYLYFGLPVIERMVRQIAAGDIWNENTLMSIATFGALLIGEYADAAAVMLLYSLGEYLQDRAFEKSRERIKAMIADNKAYADIVESGEVRRVPAGEVRVGDIIRVAAGGRIQLDGIVTDGSAWADYSSVNGEPAPVPLGRGDKAVSGGIIDRGAVEILAEKPYGESTVSLMMKAMREAEKRKSRTERAVKKFSAVYTPVVMALAVLVTIINVIIAKNTGYASSALENAAVLSALRFGLVFLVISCPCSIVLSVPLTYFAGIGAATKRGILVKGGEVLDAAADVGAVVLDKTGTLTTAEMEVERIIPADGVSEQEFIRALSPAAMRSGHPLCAAFSRSYKSADTDDITEFAELAGKGMEYRSKGRKIVCGNVKWLAANGVVVPEPEGTAILCAEGKKYLGQVIFADKIKNGMEDITQKLGSIGIADKNIYILSGDNRRSVEKTAKKAGIRNFAPELLPHEKAEKIEEIIARHKKDGRVLFAGDGLNDAAVIARADVGVAVQGGAEKTSGSSFSAADAADAVITDGRTEKIAALIQIAKKIRATVTFNMAFSVACKAAVIIFSGLVFTSMELAIIADVGVAVLCVVNSMRVMKV